MAKDGEAIGDRSENVTKQIELNWPASTRGGK